VDEIVMNRTESRGYYHRKAGCGHEQVGWRDYEHGCDYDRSCKKRGGGCDEGHQFEDGHRSHSGDKECPRKNSVQLSQSLRPQEKVGQREQARLLLVVEGEEFS